MTTMTPEEKAAFNTWCRQASERELRDIITQRRAAGRIDCVVVAKQELVARGLKTTTQGDPS